ncbi:MAG: HD domain-containing protein [Clostridiaceae bacterium]|nr:HD domain-containing protein [Clostridiaceae bacterium]
MNKKINIQIPDGAKTIINILKNNGYEAYVVGGCVRDSLLTRDPHDWDITTNCLPEDMLRIFKATHKTIPTGLKHGTITLLDEGIPFEVTTFRLDGEYSDNRRPDNVVFTSSLKEDLSRRDFTINAIAYNGEVGLVDYFGGLQDLQNKLIRCVGEAEARFNEDALRMLRAIRFSAQLGFEMHKDINLALLKLSDNIKNISVERIREEFNKILFSNSDKVSELSSFGLLKHFIPEFEICENTVQNNPYHIFPVAKHILCSVKNVENQLVLKLTMFFHDIGKPQCLTTDNMGVDHFYNHGEKSVNIAEKVLKRMKYDNKTIEKVLLLIKYHDYELKHRKQIKRLLNNIGEENLRDLLKVKVADAKAQNPEFYPVRQLEIIKAEAEIDEIIRTKQCFTLKDLKLDGRDLMQLGITPGKQIGIVLNQLLELVLDDPELNNRKKLEEIVMGTGLLSIHK